MVHAGGQLTNCVKRPVFAGLPTPAKVMSACLRRCSYSALQKVPSLAMVIRLSAITALLVVTALAFTYFSPWVGSLFFRAIMDRGSVGMVKTLERYAPSNVISIIDEHYDAGDLEAWLDVFYPAEIQKTDQALPTIVWVHGGGWLAGDKSQVAGYLKILAAQGFTVVGVGYSLAPGKHYPTPVKQVNTALKYLGDNAARLHVDANRLFLAGDSVGAQIAAQLANVIADADYARSVGIVPTIGRSSLRGVVLYCGMYDATTAQIRGGSDVWSDLGMQFWAYVGTKDFHDDPRTVQLSVAKYLTKNYPPMFIAAGNADWLTPQSYLMADRAEALGVHVERLFFTAADPDRSYHQFQFDPGTRPGQLALKRSADFIRQQSR